jgi:RNA polymerase sigma-70 factor, ECF subfamily
MLGAPVEKARKVERKPDAGVLFTRHAKALRGAIRRMGVQPSEIDDVLQNVFVVAHRRSDDVPRDDEQAKYWLLDVARKICANWLRLYRHEYEIVHLAAILETPVEDADPELFLLVQDALERLDEEDRRILEAYVRYDESLRMLAKRLGIPKSSLFLKLEQARERFRAELGELADPARFRPHGDRDEE